MHFFVKTYMHILSFTFIKIVLNFYLLSKTRYFFSLSIHDTTCYQEVHKNIYFTNTSLLGSNNIE